MDEEKALKNAKNALTNKNIDAICLNVLKDSSSFATNDNEITFITKNNQKLLDKKDKLLISFEILNEAKKLDIDN